MYAIDVHREEKGIRLQWQPTSPDPEISDRDVLIKVKAAGVNRADLLQARGLYPPPAGASLILGLEVAGTVVATGRETSRFSVGDRVCAILDGGGYAERVVVDERLVLRLPDNLSFEEGAAIPEAWITAFLNLFHEGSLAAGETVLVHSGASGVGTAAIQLAAAAGSTVFSTAGTVEKCTNCLKLGAKAAFHYKEVDFSDEVTVLTEGRGVDLVLDTVGGPYLERNVKILKRGGRLIIIGLLGGTTGSVDVGRILKNNLKIIGSTLRDRARDEKARIVSEFELRFWPKFSTDGFRPVVDVVFPVADAGSAHDYMKQNLNTGKIILKVDD